MLIGAMHNPMTNKPARHSTFPLRLSPSVRSQAVEMAQKEGISLNHFISLAVAEKVSRMEHEQWISNNNTSKTTDFSNKRVV